MAVFSRIFVIPVAIIYLKIYSVSYQAPGDCGQFPEKQDAVKSKTSIATENVGCGARFNAEQFAAMGLRTGQKRPKETQAEAVSKKNKKSKS